MATRLPTRDSLGQAPSGRSGRPIATYDVSPIGRGMQALGQGIAQAGSGIGAAVSQHEAAQDQVAKFDTERKFQEFKWNETKGLDEMLRTVEPGQADGLAEKWASGYQERAKGFFESVPDKFKPTYDQKLFGVERQGYGTTATFQRQEQKRSALADIDRIVQTYQSRAAAGEPLDNIRKDYQDLYEANPWLTPIEKDVEFREGLSGLEEAHVKGRLERGEPLESILQDLRGGALLDTDENPELRAQPFRTEKRSYKPTARFSQTVNTAINSAAEKHGVDPGLLSTFARIESSGNPNVRTGSYKGLFQLSNSEFKKYGGEGNIYDPQANADAAAQKLKAEAVLFERKYGRPAQPIDLYMQHQQGIAGYEKHLANPDAPAWQNMASTGEGKQKGDRWAKRAIWGNVPTDVRKQFPGGVESMTSADFVEVWRNKVERFGGGSTAVAQGGTKPEMQFSGPYQALPADKRSKLIRDVQIAARNRTLQEVKDGAEQIRRTGQMPTNEDGETTLDRAKTVLTRNQYEKAVMDWQAAQLEHQAFDGLPALSEMDLEDRIAAAEPEPGDELYAERARIYEKLTSEVNKLRTLREKDPAASVSDLPEVQTAEQGVKENPDDPEFIQKMVGARLDAQKAVGIPDGLQSPITRQEARLIIAPARGLEGKAMVDALTKVQEDIQEKYGPYARAVAVDAISHIVRSKEIAEEMTGILTSAMRGERASAAQIRSLEVATETAMAERAFGIGMQQDLTEQPENPQATANIEADPFRQYGMRQPPQRAIDLLKSNPSLAPQFEEKYGPGSAAIILQGQ